MARRIFRYGIPAVSALFAAVAFSACSNSNNTSPSDGGTGGSATGGGGATGGSSGAATGGSSGATTGGAPTGGSSGAATGGSSGAATGGSGGVNMGGDAGILGYVCEDNAKLIDPGGDGAANAACCTGLGACVTADSVASVPGAASFGHDSCKKSDNLVCAPAKTSDAGAAQAAALGLYQDCTASIGGTDYEGRCIPGCFTEGNPNANQLSSAGCGPDGGGPLKLVCSPCYNPVDGKSTGACNQAPGDKPGSMPPAAYKLCGAVKTDGGDDKPTGICVPTSLVLASNNPAASQLKQDECDANEYCVPALKANDVNGCFAKCTTTGALKGYIGACVPNFVVRDVNPAGLAIFGKSTCKEDELCATCVNPTSPSQPSHACQ